ncbi:type IV conjugative transfer system coupling protein TraD [Pasteurella multocida]|uniref:type IV conjugative transfer system coupling protein TraD n=1 Tax=Pasteurella multocida TaxID=747 RepID=UPI00352C1056
MSFNAKNMTQGGQVIKYMIGMFMQITNIVMSWSFILSIVAFFGYIFAVMKLVYIKHAFVYMYVKYIIFNISNSLNKANKLDRIYQFEWETSKGEVFTVTRTYADILKDDYFIKCFEMLKWNSFWALGVAILVFFVVMSIVLWYLGRQGQKQRQNDQVGGRYLAQSVNEVNSILKREKKYSDLTIGDLHIVKNSEIQNIGLHGTVGTGKSTVINNFLMQNRERNGRAIIYDKGNTFVQLFYREGKDILLNPLDSRCPNWDLWEECKDRTDLENFAQPFMPETKGADPFWVLSARNLFVTTAELMRKDADKSIKKLLNNLLAISLDDLRKYLDGEDAANLVDGSIEKTAMTIRSVLAAYVRALRLCQGLDNNNGQKFSIKEWILNADDDAWIFLSSDGRVHESIKPLITAWLNVAMQNVLALKPDLNRRVWTILDELNSLHKLPLLLEYLSEARKFGGVTLIGLQSFSQLQHNYGNDAAKAIWDLLNTTVYFRAPSGELAQWVQEQLGEIRHFKFRDQYSYGVDTIRDGVNFSKEETREHIVSYSDIQNLNDLECYVSLLGDIPVVKVKLKRKEYPIIADSRLERSLTVLDPKIDEELNRIDMFSKRAEEIISRKINGSNDNHTGGQQNDLLRANDNEKTNHQSTERANSHVETKQHDEYQEKDILRSRQSLDVEL